MTNSQRTSPTPCILVTLDHITRLYRLARCPWVSYSAQSLMMMMICYPAVAWGPKALSSTSHLKLDWPNARIESAARANRKQHAATIHQILMSGLKHPSQIGFKSQESVLPYCLFARP